MNAETTMAGDFLGNGLTLLKKYVTVLVLLGLVLLFAVIAPNFATPNNFIILLRQVSFTAISAVGIAFGRPEITTLNFVVVGLILIDPPIAHLPDAGFSVQQ